MSLVSINFSYLAFTFFRLSFIISLNSFIESQIYLSFVPRRYERRETDHYYIYVDKFLNVDDNAFAN